MTGHLRPVEDDANTVSNPIEEIHEGIEILRRLETNPLLRLPCQRAAATCCDMLQRQLPAGAT